ncbi:hypothetical protein GCM10022253_30130 [Sphingomonas endophytica]|uniref:Uncharacterized protein n=2 Tax=Sphingomonas endophytica TaxID=869719 RepID=A0ABR6N781_9SPHN|nr:hypothetical protein [Sphingomonas endophytica]MBB5726621.1 hypothetical protein [Sphingomonas endophytica]
MTAKSETLKMALGQDGRAASLTTVQKAGIFRKAMEAMRDHLEQVHVGYQRTEPDATFMIEGLVGIYEAMLRDFVCRSEPGRDRSGVGSSTGPRFGTTQAFGCYPLLGTPAAGERKSAS